MHTQSSPVSSLSRFLKFSLLVSIFFIQATNFLNLLAQCSIFCRKYNIIRIAFYKIYSCTMRNILTRRREAKFLFRQVLQLTSHISRQEMMVAWIWVVTGNGENECLQKICRKYNPTKLVTDWVLEEGTEVTSSSLTVV